jgi:exodeoxyribonuclease V alpha subunit
MKTRPEIQWLINHWELPSEAAPVVEALLEAEGKGSTAQAMEKPFDLGRAASGPDEDARTPLVVVRHGEHDHLQSRRLFEAEQNIARKLVSLASAEAEDCDDEHLEALFPGAATDDRQKLSARMALRKRLTVITGGPGTGKTYTVARILALLAARGIDPSDIALSAPTGKAADRMRASVDASLDSLPEGFPVASEDLARIAATSRTLHSLLGHRPAEGACQFNSINRLPCRVLVVDECSMIDVFLWRAMLEALPDGAKLVLVGDPDQLESVGTGDVFSEITKAAGAESGPLAGTSVQLTEARRFKDCPDIAALAAFIRGNDSGGASALLQQCQGTNAPRGVAWIEAGNGGVEPGKFPESVKESLIAVAGAGTAAEALDRLQAVCVLTAQRRFFVGSRATGEKIERWLRGQGEVANQAVIIDVNDRATGLRNGTVGVIRKEEDGSRRFHSRSASGELKSYALAQLPEHSPAWAMTIHRSQGSEYDDVLVVLPREESPLATRELLYTAITRAKKRVTVAGSLDSVKTAVETKSKRTTLLSSALDRAAQG